MTASKKAAMISQRWKTLARLAGVAAVCLAAIGSGAAQDHPFRRFELEGNTQARVAPGDTVRVRIHLAVEGTGTLQVFLVDAPPFASLNESLPCPDACQWDGLLELTPTADDCGAYDSKVAARLTAPDGSTHSLSRNFHVEVVPQIDPEPPFTRDSFNVLTWTECTAHNHELRVEPPTAAGPALAKSRTHEGSSGGKGQQVVENLQSGTRYTYWVEATLPADRAFTTLRSDQVWSTQDNAAPEAVPTPTFSVDAQGNVTLRWPIVTDGIGFVDRFVVYRRTIGRGDAFQPIRTLSFFPVTAISRPNYYPAFPELGAPVYADDTGRLTRLPAFLAGAALIRTDPRDRWSPSEAFLRLELAGPAFLYVGFDKRIKPKPTWLRRDPGVWEDINPGDRAALNLQTAEGEFKLFRTDAEARFPDGAVVLGGNFAAGAQINRRGAVPNMYVLFVQPKDPQHPLLSDGPVVFSDPLGFEHDLETFQYRIDAIDAAGNVAEGEPSPPVILDLSGKCEPAIAQFSVFERDDGRHFGRDFRNTICILDPNQDPACRGFRDTDSLHFQAVRDSLKFFDAARPEDRGRRFFDSGWIAIDQLERDQQGRICYAFDLLPAGEDPNFVNGHTYHYRVRAKDVHGNLSVWSGTLSATQDAAPPGDIANLAADVEIDDNCRNGCINLTWEAAVDSGTGVQAYQVYRKLGAGDFALVAETTETVYCDALDGFAAPGLVTYKVGSTDRLGHVRRIEASQWVHTLRVPIGPGLQTDPADFASCNGVTVTRRDTVRLCLEGDRTDVLKYRATVSHSNGATEIVLRDVSSPCFDIPLPFGSGRYQITVQAEYSHILSTCSDTLTFEKLPPVPKPVASLTATHVSDGSGDIVANWTHAQPRTVAFYRVRWWPADKPAAAREDTTSRPRFVLRFDKDQLSTYQCYAIEVRAVDCLGAVSAPDTVFQYPNRPPKIRCEEAETDGTIRITWDRPERPAPGATAFSAVVEVFQNTLANPVRRDLLPGNPTSYVFVNPQEGNNYLFRVQETLDVTPGQPSCRGPLSSAFSAVCTVPFRNLPAAVRPLQAQAQPVRPDSLGCAFLDWRAYDDPAVRRFDVLHLLDPTAPPLKTVRTTAEQALVCGLQPDATHFFTVLAVDTLGQHSVNNDTAVVRFVPPWVYTPDIGRFEPDCFRDSVRVFWHWLDAAGIPGVETFGADSVRLQISLNPTFPEQAQTTTGWLAADPEQNAHTFRRRPDYPFASASQPVVYLRIRAKDRFGNLSPWSDTFFAAKRGHFDEVPPPVVACRVFSVNAPVLAGADTVAVTLRWPAAEDTCSGTAHYEVFRDSSLIGVLPAESDRVEFEFVDRGQRTDSTLLQKTWRVRAVDRLGNRQALAEPCRIRFVVSAPDTASCPDDTTVCWSESRINVAGTRLEYFAEGARSPELFGNRQVNIESGWLDTTCFNFRVDWDMVYWRIRARAGAFESVWSDTFRCDRSGQLITTDADGPSPGLPQNYELAQNFPNPFNPTTEIRFAIPASEKHGVRVVLDVFNIVGQRIRRLVEETRPPGAYRVVWDGRDDTGALVGSGVYVYRLQAGPFLRTRKMVFLK